MINHLFWLAVLVLLSGCSAVPTTPDAAGDSAGSSRYDHAQDFTPKPIEDVYNLPEPQPKSEPRSAMGNPASYRVLGQEYRVLPTAAAYRERGQASWYGMKFHGHRTSNGEIYDVYKFTAAHKTLPLPSYVRVTRTDNSKSVIVRVNDRGPFHQGRIIDLSYAAAVKLGMERQGVANVEVEVIEPAGEYAVRWVQVGALRDAAAAQRLQQQIQQHLQESSWPVTISTSDAQPAVHRVRIGPVPEGSELQALLDKLQPLNLGQPLLLATHQL